MRGSAVGTCAEGVELDSAGGGGRVACRDSMLPEHKGVFIVDQRAPHTRLAYTFETFESLYLPHPIAAGPAGQGRVRGGGLSLRAGYTRATRYTGSRTTHGTKSESSAQ